MKRAVGFSAAAFLGLASLAFSYTFQGNTRVANDGKPYRPSLPVTYRYSSGTSDALDNIVNGSDPRAAIDAGFAQWTKDSGFSVTLGADSSETDAGVDSTEYLMTFADTAVNQAIFTFNGQIPCESGPLGVTLLRFTNDNVITDADIAFSPCRTWSTTGSDGDWPVRSIATHEIGHWLGLDHSVLGAATMYPFGGAYGSLTGGEVVPDTISGDDRAGANVLYPGTGWGAKTGAIEGLVTRSGSPLYGAHVVATRTTDGLVFGSDITRGVDVPGGNGRYRIEGLPPGSYTVHAEPADGPTTFSNWRKSSGGSTTFWYEDTFPIDWKSSFLGGNGSPTSVAVSAGGVASPADLVVTTGAPLDNPTRIGTTVAPGMGGGSAWSGGPLILAPGSSLWVIVLDLGGGISSDSITSVSCSDPDVTVSAVDEPILFAPPTEAIRFQLTIPADAVPGPRSLIFVTSNGETSFLTGFIDVSGPDSESTCDDAADDDGDGCIDCDDSDCTSEPVCVDQCPDDPDKLAPGVCGCGVADDDTDGDGVEDCNDPCPVDNPDDSDADSVCDSVDACPGQDDLLDGDGDGTPDCLDPCPLDNPDDSDADGVCDSSDACPGFDDNADGDGDGKADGCDPCPADNPDDSDGDTVCDSADACPGQDDLLDGDGDGTPDCLDPCPLDDPDDSDADGVCDSSDACPGFDDNADGDGDGTADGCDDCPADNPDDSDGDTVCDSVDACPGQDDRLDGDGDGTPDCLDGCPSDGDKTAPGTCGCGVPDEDLNGDTVPDCCVAGDVWPDGVGDDAVDLRDWAQAVFKTVTGSVPIVAHDLTCGDVGPTADSCLPSSGPRRSCPDRDAAFTAADADVIRGLAAGTHAISCDPCLVDRDSPGGDFRRVADVAPRVDGGDGSADIGDVLLILNWAVGNQNPPMPGDEEFLRADVAPFGSDADLRVVQGDGSIDISDVLAVIRHVVGLNILAWPRREVTVNATGAPADFIGFQVTIDGWDDYAEKWDLTALSAACGISGGLDLIDNKTVISCLGDSTSGNQALFELGYRAPEKAEPDSMSVTLIEEDFDLPPGTVVLVD